MTIHRLSKKAARERKGPAYKGRLTRAREACLGSSRGSVRDVDNGTGRKGRAGSPPGGPVRSIRKNNILPGSCPTDLHFGKNGIVRANCCVRSKFKSDTRAALGFPSRADPVASVLVPVSRRPLPRLPDRNRPTVSSFKRPI